MGTTQDALKAHLMDTNQEFRNLVLQHSDYSKKLEELTSRSYLTAEEQVEEVRLKKMKLRLKDQMEGILNRHKAGQQVA
jgi:uncharacterized protein YdcH (DUF465 family)